MGDPDASISYAEDSFSFTYRDFPYTVGVKAEVTQEADGYTLGDREGMILLEMAHR